MSRASCPRFRPSRRDPFRTTVLVGGAVLTAVLTDPLGHLDAALRHLGSWLLFGAASGVPLDAIGPDSALSLMTGSAFVVVYIALAMLLLGPGYVMRPLLPGTDPARQVSVCSDRRSRRLMRLAAGQLTAMIGIVYLGPIIGYQFACAMALAVLAIDAAYRPHRRGLGALLRGTLGRALLASVLLGVAAVLVTISASADAETGPVAQRVHEITLLLAALGAATSIACLPTWSSASPSDRRHVVASHVMGVIVLALLIINITGTARVPTIMLEQAGLSPSVPAHAPAAAPVTRPDAPVLIDL